MIVITEDALGALTTQNKSIQTERTLLLAKENTLFSYHQNEGATTTK